MNKQEYVKLVKSIRAMLTSNKDSRCPCPKTKCEWYGRCYECVRIHRHFGDHVPNCMQAMLQDRIKALAGVAELNVDPKAKTPDAYWDYVKKVAPLKRPSRNAGARRRARQ